MRKQFPAMFAVVIGLLALLAASAFATNPMNFERGLQEATLSASPTNLQPAAEAQGNPNVRVWVNTNSDVYHCPGTRWYGNTKSGEYMTQKQAQEKGYRPAYGKACQ